MLNNHHQIKLMDERVSRPVTTQKIRNVLVDDHDSDISRIQLYKQNSKQEVLESISLSPELLSETEK